MECNDSVYFEFNLDADMITFMRTGLWDDILKKDEPHPIFDKWENFVTRMVHPDDRGEAVAAFQKWLLLERMGMESSPVAIEFRAMNPDANEYQWFSMRAVLRHNMNTGFGTIECIQTQKLAALENVYKASHDSLTDALNREVFEKVLEGWLRVKNSCGMFGILDIDDFKSVNDRHGHLFGDNTLKHIVNIMKTSMPDGALIGRMGGDEFYFYIPDVGDRDKAASVGEQIISDIRDDRQLLSCTVSIGIALYPQHSRKEDMNILIHAADMALYRAKAEGKNSFAIYGSTHKSKPADNLLHKGKQWTEKNKRLLKKRCFLLVCLLLVFLFGVYIGKRPQTVTYETTEYLGRMNVPFQLTRLLRTGVAVLFVLLLLKTAFAQHASRKKLREMAYVDEVTGRLSKGKFELDAAVLLKREKQTYSIVYANIERFKFVNDQFGREHADELLREVCLMLEEDLSGEERVCHLMADHFAILAATQNMDLLVERMEGWNSRLMQIPMVRENLSYLSLSYGIYPVRNTDANVSDMLDRANLARQAIKSHSYKELHYGVYDDCLREKLSLELELEGRMEQALETGEFFICLQPKYVPKGDVLAGAEALVRWEIPGRGILSPGIFIPLFERNGFVGKVDLFVFEEACRFLERLKNEGIPALPVSVNLSRAVFTSREFLEHYIEIWERYDIPPEWLIFEITESLIFNNEEVFGDIVRQLHELGFKVSMDDFGSGYSSLNLLGSIAADEVKLDQQFFGRSRVIDGANAEIVKAVIALARQLHMQTVAEGIESEEQVNFLRDNGCDLIQGYYYSRPIPVEAMLDLLRQSRCATVPESLS